jgi:hypothetical protein
MLNETDAAEIRRIARLAAAARKARDNAFLNAAALELDEPKPQSGQARPANRLGLAALPDDDPAARALRDAIETASPEMRCKLWAVMRTGSGGYARNDWDRAMADAALLSHAAFISELADEADLPERLMKGLFELGRAELEDERP